MLAYTGQLQVYSYNCSQIAQGKSVKKNIYIHVYFNLHITQSNITKQHKTSVISPIGAAVIGRLGDHISEVDTLSEHVTGDRSFGGCNSETLRQDSSIVGGSGTVPQKHSVVQFLELFEAFRFALAGNFEDLDINNKLIFLYIHKRS